MRLLVRRLQVHLHWLADNMTVRLSGSRRRRAFAPDATGRYSARCPRKYIGWQPLTCTARRWWTCLLADRSVQCGNDRRFKIPLTPKLPGFGAHRGWRLEECDHQVDPPCASRPHPAPRRPRIPILHRLRPMVFDAWRASAPPAVAMASSTRAVGDMRNKSFIKTARQRVGVLTDLIDLLAVPSPLPGILKKPPESASGQ